ncbi:MAG TPA: hypothetical protein VGB89_00090 [Bacteroidota bacterium]|jgi:hypothetical protein
MITLPTAAVEIEEVKQERPFVISATAKDQFVGPRPEVTQARVYKMKSGFIRNSVFITLGYVTENKKNRPIEIFINSKDLTRAAEYTVLTRLISAIFRKSTDPTFILEELRGIYDPNGGYFKEGKYIHSFYAEVAKVIERFFEDIGVIQQDVATAGLPSSSKQLLAEGDQDVLKICPKCGNRSLKMENGCMACVDTECGYSKCDD